MQFINMWTSIWKDINHSSLFSKYLIIQSLFSKYTLPFVGTNFRGLRKTCIFGLFNFVVLAKSAYIPLEILTFKFVVPLYPRNPQKLVSNEY